MDILEGFQINRESAATNYVPANVVRAARFLDKLPPHQLLSSVQVSEAMGLARGYFRDRGLHPHLLDYRIRVPRVNGILWGSKKAIEEIKRRMNANRSRGA